MAALQPLSVTSCDVPPLCVNRWSTAIFSMCTEQMSVVSQGPNAEITIVKAKLMFQVHLDWCWNSYWLTSSLTAENIRIIYHAKTESICNNIFRLQQGLFLWAIHLLITLFINRLVCYRTTAWVGVQWLHLHCSFISSLLTEFRSKLIH